MKIKILNEKLGVPDGIIDSSKKIYDYIINELKKRNKQKIITEKDKDKNHKTIFLGKIKISINDLIFKNISIYLQLYLKNKNTKPKYISSSIFNIPSEIGDTYYFYDKNNINNINLNIKYYINKNSDYSEIVDSIKNNKEILGYISHELNHSYYYYKKGKILFKDIVDYELYLNVNTQIDEIDEFFHLVYFTSNFENVVRNSEIAALIKEYKITKKQFLDFLKSTNLYKTLKKAENFSLYEMRNKMLKNIRKIKKELKKLEIDYSNLNNDEIVDFIIHETYSLVYDKGVENIKKMLNLNIMEELFDFLIPQEKHTHLQNYMYNKKFKNKNKYFKHYEYTIRNNAKKVLKKLYKLYDMCLND